MSPKSLRTIHVQRHKDGTIWAKGTMVGGVPHGAWAWFRKDGTRLRSGTFTEGQPTGAWTTYDRTGRPYKTTTRKSPSAKGRGKMRTTGETRGSA